MSQQTRKPEAGARTARRTGSPVAKAAKRATAAEVVPAVKVVKRKGKAAEAKGQGRRARRPVKAAWTPDQMLANGRHELFAQKMALNAFSQSSCYLQAYPDSGTEAARRSASELMTKPDVRARIDWIRAEAVKNVKITLEEQLRWYVTVRDIPIGYVDEESPLAQEVTREEVTKQDDRDAGEVVTKVKIKMPSKMDAAKQIDVLMGFAKADKERERQGDAIVDLLQWIRGGANVSGKGTPAAEVKA